MRVLVTGAAGSVGTIIAPRLAQEHELLLTDLPEKGVEVLDVTDARAVREAVDWCDVVVHCAVAGGQCNDWRKHSWLNAMRRVNIDCGGTLNVLWTAAELGKRAVYVSSINAIEYGSLGQYVTEDTPLAGGAVYGLTKAFGEKCARELHNDLGLRVAVVRPGGLCETSLWNAHYQGVGLSQPLPWQTSEQDLAEGMAAVVRVDSSIPIPVHLTSDCIGRRWSLERMYSEFGFYPRWQNDSCGFWTELDPEAGSLQLRIASSLGDTESVRNLCSDGADPNQYGGDPLRQAAASGDAECFSALLRLGADPTIDGGQALSWAIARGHEDLSCELLSMNVANQKELSAAVWHATITDNAEMVRRLLEAGADPNFGSGELMRRAIMQDMPGHWGNTEIVRLLREHGYKWQCEFDSEIGKMPLELAVECGIRPDVVQALVDMGADPRSVSNVFLRTAARYGYIEQLRIVGRDSNGEELEDANGSPDDLWLRYLESCK